jgi:hypothetical protein
MKRRLPFAVRRRRTQTLGIGVGRSAVDDRVTRLVDAA